MQKRICRGCGVVKDLSEFHKSTRDGTKSRCRDCCNAHERRRYWDNPEVFRAKQREKDALAWRSKSPEERRRRRLKAKYGLTQGDIDEMLAKQCGCAICHVLQPDGIGWETDHDHVTGRVRGILCGGCNRGLGQFRDIPERLEAAAAYLRAA